jgi:geranylgeranyl diphosphate synthase, type II
MELINSRLEQLVPADNAPEAPLYEAARYSLLAPAKRFRPSLAIICGKSLGASLSSLLDPACALEMIHTYSLIHDDLPCMDDDDMRRGRASLHKVYPEWLALLTGDFLLTKAFELVADWPKIVTLLAKNSGGRGMIGGQVVDLLANREHLDYMHEKKTGALIEASLLIGGIVAGIPELDLLSNAGLALGSAFQTIDDIIDVTKTQDEAGKPTGVDQKKGKVTAVTLLGLNGAYDKAEELLQTCYQNLDAAPLHNREIIHYIERWACSFLTRA